MADDKQATDAAGKEDAAAKGKGGMLPLILTIVLMPVMAFVMTNFVLLPKIQKAIVASASSAGVEMGEDGHGAEGESHDDADGHGADDGHGGEEGAAKLSKGDRATYDLQKLIVNVRGTMGTRFLMASFTLVGKGSAFVTLCENNDAQLRDVAMGVLAGKTIQDLEKPDSRNMVRTEMISTFNTALGKPAVKELFITEFAIQ